MLYYNHSKGERKIKPLEKGRRNMKQLRVFKKEVTYADFKEKFSSDNAVPDSYDKEKKTIFVYINEYVEAEPLSLESLPKLEGDSKFFEACRTQFFLRTIPQLKAQVVRAYQVDEKAGKWFEDIYLKAYDLLYASPTCPSIWGGVPLYNEERAQSDPNFKAEFATGMENVKRARCVPRTYEQTIPLSSFPGWMPEGYWNRKIYGKDVKYIYVDGEKYELSEDQAEELKKII